MEFISSSSSCRRRQDGVAEISRRRRDAISPAADDDDRFIHSFITTVAPTKKPPLGGPIGVLCNYVVHPERASRERIFFFFIPLHFCFEINKRDSNARTRRSRQEQQLKNRRSARHFFSFSTCCSCNRIAPSGHFFLLLLLLPFFFHIQSLNNQQQSQLDTKKKERIQLRVMIFYTRFYSDVGHPDSVNYYFIIIVHIII